MIVFDTPPNPGHLPECITHFGRHEADGPLGDATVTIYIWTNRRSIPQPPFPF